MQGVEEAGSNDLVEVGFHVFENHVEVLLVFGGEDLEELDDVLVVGELLEEDHFAEGALGVGSILEGVENLEWDERVTFLSATCCLVALSTAFQTMP